MKTLPIGLRAYERQQRLFGRPLHELTTVELLAAARVGLQTAARGVLKSADAIREMVPSKVYILG